MDEKQVETSNEIKIIELEEFIKEILKLGDSLLMDLQKDEKLLFRGQENTNFQLLPSLGRFSDNLSCKSILKIEKRLIEDAQVKFPNEFCNEKYPINLLAKLQHYGIPTRLLDLTSNPLMALYFACCGSDDDDGEIFIFKVNNDNNSSSFPLVNAIADSYKFASSCVDLDYFFEDTLNKPYFLEHMPSIHYLKRKEIEELFRRPLFVNALELTTRQKVQKGKFIIFPNETKEENGRKYFAGNIREIEKNSEYILKRIIVAKESKTTILKHLSILGISRASLFADNIDIVCKEITERQKDRIRDLPD